MTVPEEEVTAFIMTDVHPVVVVKVWDKKVKLLAVLVGSLLSVNSVSHHQECRWGPHIRSLQIFVFRSYRSAELVTEVPGARVGSNPDSIEMVSADIPIDWLLAWTGQHPLQVGRTWRKIFIVPQQKTPGPAIIGLACMPGDHGWRLVLEIIGIHYDAKTGLFQIACAIDGFGPLLRLGQGGQQHSGQNCNDRDDYQ